MAAAELEIVEVVRRGDFYGTRALLRIRVGIGDDGNAAAGERQHHVAADQIGVARILGVHGHRHVAQHRFGARGRHRDGAIAALDRIDDVPEIALHLAALDFQVGDRGLEFRIPVHQTPVAIDQALIVQRDEHRAHGLVQALVHGEAFARPIETGAEAAQLARDGAAGFRLPIPHARQERLAPHRLARGAFLAQQALDHHLRGDAGMIRARLPERVAALQAAPADQRILQREGERMTHVQAAGDVRRRDHDGVGRLVAGGVRAGGKGAGGFPAGIERLLYGSVVEGFVEHGAN